MVVTINVTFVRHPPDKTRGSDFQKYFQISAQIEAKFG